MNMERRYILLVAPVAFALVNWLPNDLSAEDLQEAKVTQVVQDVKVVLIRCSGASGGGERDCSPGQRRANRDPVQERADV